MKHLRTHKGVLTTIVLTVFLAVAIPATALGQGRGHGQGHGRGRNQTWSTWNNKKCGKFVNCHDARDGRWDGRGPRGDRVSNSVRHRRYRNRNTQNRWLQRRARLLNQ
jgi:hypothetical protein